MPSVETQLTLQADEDAVVWFLEEHDGILLREQDEATYWLVLRPKHERTQTYHARVAWAAYPDAPPSVVFADGIGGVTTISRAWPNIPGYRVGSWDICKPFTAEAFNVHPEWRTGPTAWTSTGNPFLWVAQTLQYDLNSKTYQGRQP